MRVTSTSSIKLHHLDGEVQLLLSGDVGLDAVPALRDACSSLAYRYDGDQIVIDCTKVQLLEMTALGVLVELCNKLGDSGRPRLTGASPVLLRVLATVGLTDRFTVATSSRV